MADVAERLNASMPLLEVKSIVSQLDGTEEILATLFYAKSLTKQADRVARDSARAARIVSLVCAFAGISAWWMIRLSEDGPN